MIGCSGNQAVTLVVGRADLLAALGTLLAGLAATHRRDPARARSWPGLLATGGAVGLACLAKENGFVSPLLVGVVLAVPACRKRSGTPAAAATGTASATARPRVDRHQRGPSTGTAGWIRERLPLALAVLLPIVVVLLLRLAVLGQLMRGTPPAFDDNPIAHAGLVAGRLTALRLLGHSLLLFLRPWPLSIDYSHAALPVPAVSLASVWPVLVGALLLGVLAWVLRRRPVALCGLAWFFVAQAATANLLVPIGTIYAERLLYLPLAGICLLVGDLTGALVAPLTRRSPGTPRRVLVAGFALITLAVPALLTARTWAREAEFKDDLTVWNAAVSAVPGSAKAHYNLGRSLAARDRHIDAAEQYREALRIAPTHVLALNNLGASELRRQRPAEALVALDRAAALAPGAAEVAFNQALALHALDRVEAAATAFARGALSDPALARTLAARGEPWASLAAGTR